MGFEFRMTDVQKDNKDKGESKYPKCNSINIFK